MAKGAQAGRCLNCRAEVSVPDTFADGDSIQCGVCGTSLKIVRGGGPLRLLIADVGPLRDEMKAVQLRIGALESDLARARASFGIGANGLGLGVLYVVAQVGLEEKQISRGLLLTALAISLVSGIALELANLFFLAKRREMARLSAEIDQARADLRLIQRKIQESVRR
jgi:hypothetical protein